MWPTKNGGIGQIIQELQNCLFKLVNAKERNLSSKLSVMLQNNLTKALLLVSIVEAKGMLCSLKGRICDVTVRVHLRLTTTVRTALIREPLTVATMSGSQLMILNCPPPFRPFPLEKTNKLQQLLFHLFRLRQYSLRCNESLRTL